MLKIKPWSCAGEKEYREMQESTHAIARYYRTEKPIK